MPEETRLSSQHLYHFTTRIEFLKSILQNGFEHRHMQEDLPLTSYPGTVWSFPGLIQHRYTFSGICFCDIPERAIGDHSNQYGKFGMVLSKTWGISNGITPIRYIHHATPDFADETFYSIRDSLAGIQNFGGSFCEMIMRMLEQTQNIPFPTRDEFEALPEKFQRYFSQIDAELLPILSYARRYLGLCRAYEGEWTDRVTGESGNRTFYDEKEWRSLKTRRDQGNLRFQNDDVIAVVVSSQEEKDEIRVFIENENLGLGEKVYLLGEYLAIQGRAS